MRQILDCFNLENEHISSDKKDLKSNDVLAVLRPHLEQLDFIVETGKSKEKKIDVPVLFGVNNKIDKSFYADALSKNGKIVIEVEAGQATENHRFLKDIFEASMMFDVEYLVLAVRNKYRTHKDFEIVFNFLETLYISNRINLPLKGILLIGYWNMKMDLLHIEYNGKTYPVAEIPDVFTHEKGRYLLIGSHSLNLALYNDEYGYPDETARVIDEKIYSFIDDEYFDLSEEEFIAKAKERLD